MAVSLHSINSLEGALCTRACVCARLLSFTHVADGGQFLSRVALFQQRPGVLGRIAAVVVHREFGAHEVGPDGEQNGVETPTNDVLVTFMTLRTKTQSLKYY